MSLEHRGVINSAAAPSSDAARHRLTADVGDLEMGVAVDETWTKGMAEIAPEASKSHHERNGGGNV
jgi:hypothetical protein